MNIELVKLTHEYKDQLFDMLEEWKNDIIENHTNISHGEYGQMIFMILMIM